MVFAQRGPGVTKFVGKKSHHILNISYKIVPKIIIDFTTLLLLSHIGKFQTHGFKRMCWFSSMES